MKRTRVVFGLEGPSKAIVDLAATNIPAFKGVELLKNNVTEEKLNSVFRKNKSALVICDESNFSLLSTKPFIPIYVTLDENLQGDCINLAESNLERQFQTIANRHNIDIGDSIASEWRESGDSAGECFFCKLFIGLIKERIRVYQSEHFLVVPGKGAFFGGYFLVLPLRHIMSFAELTAQEHQEFLTVVNDIKFVLGKMYHKPILFWENGSGENGWSKSPNSVVHAHGHLMPVNYCYDICCDTLIHGVPLVKIQIEDLKHYSVPPYLLVQNPIDNEWYMRTSESHYIPRQFVRQLLCEDLVGDNTTWDWRLYPLWQQVDQNGIDFLNYVRSHYSCLPERIRERTSRFI